MNNYLLTLVGLCFYCLASAQPSLQITRTEEPIKIDGILSEAAWEGAAVADNFQQYRPSPGPRKQDTEIRVLYDDQALYVAAYMKESSRDSIMTQLTERDNIGNTDFIGFYIDPYQQGNEGFEFILASTGVQFDAKIDPNNEDQNWDAVWFSEVQLTDEGWYAEFAIPYSAIRFPKKEEQSWSINFFRRRAVSGTNSAWAPVDFERDNPFLTQTGEITGIKNIKPPLRLSISPYASFYVQNSKDKNRTPVNSTGYSYNGGLDLKYGINDAFTLDMTLIPDFGQVQSDDQVLNLSPFEVRFDERRQFFTEGTDLFNKAGIFYSRRIGGNPIGQYQVFDDITENEELISNPQNTQLYNATKISGRNSSGLGIGVFNAVSAASNAVIRDIETGAERNYETSPLTNYNVVIFDKNLKNNSSVSLTNTNVWRTGENFSSANVTATTFNLKNKGQVWGVEGGVNVSQVLNPTMDNELGHSINFSASRLSGKITYGFNYEEISDTYDHNDLGFLRYNNTREYHGWAQYNDVDGFGRFVQFQSWFNTFYERLYEPDEHIGLGFNGGVFAQGKNQWYYNAWTNYRPKRNDFFEPRTPGRHYVRPSYANIGGFIATDNRKPWRIEGMAFISKSAQEGRQTTQFQLGPRYRFSDQFNLGFAMILNTEKNSEGFVDNYNDEIIIGRRDVNTITNRIGATYTFNKKMSLDFRLRHYWSKVNYHSFHELQEDGYLDTTDYEEYNDNSFNSFNIDMVYQWRFAPGSDIFIVWKNNTLGYASDNTIDYSELSYRDGIRELSDLQQNNSLSVRVVYYLDYAQLNRVF